MLKRASEQARERLGLTQLRETDREKARESERERETRRESEKAREQESEAAARRRGPKRAGGAGKKLIIELTISGRCRRRPCAADGTEGEDAEAEPGPFRRRLTLSVPSALLAVAEEDLDVEDDEALAERA